MNDGDASLVGALLRDLDCYIDDGILIKLPSDEVGVKTKEYVVVLGVGTTSKGDAGQARKIPPHVDEGVTCPRRGLGSGGFVS